MNSILNFQERQCCLKKKGGGSRTSKHMIYIDSTSTKYWLPSTSWRLCQKLHMITTVCIQCIWIKIHNSHRSLLLKFVFKSFIYLYIYFIYSYVCTTCKHIQSCYCFVFFQVSDRPTRWKAGGPEENAKCIPKFSLIKKSIPWIKDALSLQTWQCKS